MEQTGKIHNSCEEFKIWEVIWTISCLLDWPVQYRRFLLYISLSFFFSSPFSMQVFNLITERIIYALTDGSNFLDGDWRNLIWT